MLKAIGKIGFFYNASGGSQNKYVRFRVSIGTLDSYPEEGLDYGYATGAPINNFTLFEFGHADLVSSIDLSQCTLTILGADGITTLLQTTLDVLSEVQLYKAKIFPEFSVVLNIGGVITTNKVILPTNTSLIIFNINILNAV